MEVLISKEAISQNIFSDYIEKPSLFINKKTLTATFVPTKIPHRDNEINQLTTALAPALKGYHINNIFIYGTCGTGKTICSRFVISQLEDIAKKGKKNIKTVYVNCKMKKVADTEYRLFAQLLKELGETVPDTGLPTDVLYRKFFERVDNENQTMIIVLDEIDTLFRKIGDDFLYNLTRINTELERAKISIIGITNDLSFRDNLDLRVKSSLSEEELLFKPYNALQLKNILQERVVGGFKNDVVDDAVISKCSALAAQEHGDARRALDLLRVAGEIAERDGSKRITEEHVDIAEEKIDMDRTTELVKTQPKQSQAVLYAIIKLNNEAKDAEKWVDNRLLTGDVISVYKQICLDNALKPLTQRRVSDLISELDMLGIITTKVISKGRYGRTRDISISMHENATERVNKYLTERLG